MYRTGLLAYYDYPISTGPLEGTNNKIKTMKRQAYPTFRRIQSAIIHDRETYSLFESASEMRAT